MDKKKDGEKNEEEIWKRKKKELRNRRKDKMGS